MRGPAARFGTLVKAVKIGLFRCPAFLHVEDVSGGQFSGDGLIGQGDGFQNGFDRLGNIVRRRGIFSNPCWNDEPVNDWRVTFTAPPGTGNITVTGKMAAEGPVAVALNGFGNFGGLQSLTQLGNFSVTVAAGTTNTLDFIFTGCISYPACSSSNEPVYGLLVDPNWSPALPGTPLDTIPESVLFADGGVAPSSAMPEPGSLLLLGTGLLGVMGAARRRLLA